MDLASEILKRTAYLEFPPLSDEDLVVNAEGTYLQLDELDVSCQKIAMGHILYLMQLLSIAVFQAGCI
nr:hypothetical protein [Chamaesiphon sp. OTE_8_metabat_110]